MENQFERVTSDWCTSDLTSEEGKVCTRVHPYVYTDGTHEEIEK